MEYRFRLLGLTYNALTNHTLNWMQTSGLVGVLGGVALAPIINDKSIGKRVFFIGGM